MAGPGVHLLCAWAAMPVWHEGCFGAVNEPAPTPSPTACACFVSMQDFMVVRRAAVGGEQN